MIKFCDLLVDKAALLTSFENLLEMEFLAYIGDIDNPVTLNLVDSVSEGSQVRGSIAEASILLLDHEWRSFLLANEDALGSLVLYNDAFLFEFLHHWQQHRVIETLSLLGQCDVQAIVDFLELFTRKLAKHFPALETSFISAL